VIRGAIAKFCDLAARHVPWNGMRVRCQRVKGVKVGANTYIGYDAHIDAACPELVSIDDHARIGIGVIILAHNRPGDAMLPYLGETRAPVHIGRHATLEAGVIVMPGVTVGECAIARAGSVVEEDVEPYTVVSGVPARMTARLPHGTPDAVRQPP
jgi:maltose O-acetyltransferase